MSDDLSNKDFIESLNNLCHKHQVYLASVEGQDGLCILPIEDYMKSAGYNYQADSKNIDFDWY